MENRDYLIILYDYYGELLNDKVKYSTEERKGKVEISVQNKSNKKLNRINFTVLYLDDSGKLLDFETVQEYNLKSKDTNEISAYGIWDGEKGKYLDFYKYEIILDYAENY